MIDFNAGTPLKDASNDLFLKYNIKDIHSLISIGDATIKNTTQVMYMELNFNSTPVLIIYKYVKIIKNQFVRLLHFPITKDGDVTLENKVLKFLSKQDVVQEIVTSDEDLIHHNFAIKDNFDLYATDFYDILDNDLVYKVNRGKYKSKIKYTKYKDSIDFRHATTDDYTDIMILMNTWKTYKDDTDKLFNKKTFNTIEKHFETLLLPPFYTYVITFNGNIVAFEVLYEQGDILYQLVNQAYREINDVATKDVIDYVHKWNHKLTIDTFINLNRFKIINYEYASDPNGGLFNFKNNMYAYKTPLYRLKFKKG